MQKIISVDEYIKTFPPQVQEILQALRSKIKEIVPEATETISYGIPTFKLKGKNLVHFGGYKSHIGFYPGSAAIEVFKKDLKEFKTSKGAIQFPLTKPLPYPLIKKIVEYRRLNI
jgi:uncharacterized protein YdhG (YjbR/CyaY superfamily)